MKRFDGWRGAHDGLTRAVWLAMAAVAMTSCGASSDNAALVPIAPTPTIAVASSGSVSAARGATSNVTITVTRGGGYTGTIALAATGVPSGVTATFAPATLTGTAASSALSLTATSIAALATTSITVEASGTGVATVQTVVALAVTQPLPVTLPMLGTGAVPERYTSELWVRGTTAYSSSWGTRGAIRGNAIKIWDVNANVPTLLDSIVVADAGTTGDVQVSDDGKLLVVGIEPNANGGLAIYQLDTPRSARLLVRTTGGELRYGVHTVEVARVNGVLYAFCSIDPASGVPARLVIMSLADPANPTTVASLQMGTPYIHDVFVRDGLLFTAEWNDGVGIWDIGGGGTGGTLAAPKRIGRVATVGGQVHNVWWLQDPVTGIKKYLLIGQEGPGTIGSSSIGDVHVVDMSNMTAPVEVARYNVPGAGVHNFSVDEANGLAYAAYYNAGMRVLDVRGELGTCLANQKTTDGRCDLTLMGRERATFSGNGGQYVWGVHFSTSGMFVSDMLNGLIRVTPATR